LHDVADAHEAAEGKLASRQGFDFIGAAKIAIAKLDGRKSVASIAKVRL
jgi:hypothetical protein